MYLAVKKELLDIYHFRYVVYSYVETFLKLRYRRSYLGFVWTVLAPLIHFVVIGVVFSILMRGNRDDYFAYYFSGAVVFAIISGALNRGMMAFISNENFIKKIYVPKMIYILQAVAVEYANFFLSAIALIILGVLTGHLHFTPYFILILYPLFLLFFALVGITCMLAIATVYFRDLINIIPALLQALFFATPILYDENMFPKEHHWVFEINPLYYFLFLIRTPLLEAQRGPYMLYFYSTLGCFALFVVGALMIKLYDNKIVFKL